MVTSRKFCGYCGAKIASDSEFCEKCGKQLTPQEEIATLPTAKIQDRKVPRTKVFLAIIVVVLLAMVALYAFLPLFISTHGMLVLSLQRVTVQPPPVTYQSGPPQAQEEYVYFVWHLENHGPFPIVISNAVWSVPGYSWNTKPDPLLSLMHITIEPPRTDFTLMPFGEYSYPFRLTEERCYSDYYVSNACSTAAIIPSGPVALVLTGRVQILLLSDSVNLSATA